MAETAIDFDARYSVAGMEGIAFYLLGYDTEPMFDGEDTYEIMDEGFVQAVMVGDDRVHIVDVDDLTIIHDEDYCSGCGQIGCGWG